MTTEIFESVILLLLMLQFKHLIVDWCWQPEYEWRNKGTYGHFGGIIHALKNAIGTTLCFIPFAVNAPVINVLIIFAIDFLIHYHTDWAKMNINRIAKWGPLTHPQFWWLTGLDQFIHQGTYLFLVWYLFNNIN